ncbi:MAG: DUF192 domain-containing protein [Oceanipulchritudo sp.]
MQPRLFLFLLVLGSAFTACNKRDESAQGPLGVEAWLPLRINGIDLEAQFALTPAEQQKGLMHREELGKNRGMLFPYKSPRRMSFWMANTPLPLDIGFFDNRGMLLEIHRLVPYDTSQVVSRSREAQYALEMNSGWFAANRLFPGVKLDKRLLAEALERRGADPAAYGIRTDRD